MLFAKVNFFINENFTFFPLGRGYDEIFNGKCTHQVLQLDEINTEFMAEI